MNFSAALKAPPKRTNGTVSVFRELSKATEEMRKNLKGKAGGCKTKKKARPQTKEKGNMNRLTTSDISYRRDIVHGLHFQTKYVFLLEISSLYDLHSLHKLDAANESGELKTRTHFTS